MKCKKVWKQIIKRRLKKIFLLGMRLEFLIFVRRDSNKYL